MSQPPTLAYMAPSPSEVDLQHLRLLALFHWIWGGLTALFSCIFLIHIGMGVLALQGKMPMGPTPTTGPAPFQTPEFFGWMMIGIGGSFMLVGWTLALVTLYSGFCLRKQRYWMYSLIIAALNCAFFPFGTALGVFTIIVLVRESTKRLYAEVKLQRSGNSTST